MSSETKDRAKPSLACSYVDEYWATPCLGTFYGRSQDKSYCVLHLPLNSKVADFNLALRRKIDAKDYNFRGVWFPEELILRHHDFDTEARFSYAVFMKGVDLTRAKFAAPAKFTKARFIGKANFRQVEFNMEAKFNGAIFEDEVDLSYARFVKEANFIGTQAAAAMQFYYSTFEDYVRFSGDKGHGVFSERSSLNLQHARVEKPDHVYFHSVRLRPHWFINIDARKFDFISVEWQGDLNEEAQCLIDKGFSSPYGPLCIAYRQLAVNTEENHRYEEATTFRYWSMSARRRDKWNGLAFWKTDWLHMLYWAVSGYGERILRAFAVLASVWILFVLLYTQVGFTKPESRSETPTTNPVTAAAEPDTIGQPLSLKRAWIYSALVMSLQKPEPKPLTGTAQTLVLLETILGPVQAALLALAIRRKFMR